MAYIYDVVIMRRRLQDVEEIFTQPDKQRNKTGLEINGKKTTFMIVARKPDNDNEYDKFLTYNCEIVKDNTYFGTNLMHKNDLRLEIAKRITNAHTAYALLPVLNSQSVVRAEKIKICKTSGNIWSRILDNE